MYTLCLSRISYRFTIRFSVQKRCRALHLGYQYTQFSKFVKSGGEGREEGADWLPLLCVLQICKKGREA